MADASASIGDAPPNQSLGDSALPGSGFVEQVDEDVGVQESSALIHLVPGESSSSGGQFPSQRLDRRDRGFGLLPAADVIRQPASELLVQGGLLVRGPVARRLDQVSSALKVMFFMTSAPDVPRIECTRL